MSEAVPYVIPKALPFCHSAYAESSHILYDTDFDRAGQQRVEPSNPLWYYLEVSLLLASF